MNKILMIYPNKCVHCKLCELACSFQKTGKKNPKESAVNVIVYKEAGISVPIMCMQCEDAACMKVCPVAAFSRDENGAVVSDSKKCIGCKICISACPMGNISYSFSEMKIVKCDLCGGDPACVKVCHTEAIRYEEATTACINKKKIIAEKFKDVFVQLMNK